MASLASCSALGGPGSASHEARAASSSGVQGGGVDIAPVAVVGHDGQRRRVRVEGFMRTDHRQAEPIAETVLGQPGRELTRHQRTPPRTSKP